MTKEKSKEDIFCFMKISNATVTSKQNFIEKYQRLIKNLYNQNCSWKNEGNINTVSEISKIHSLHGFFTSSFKNNIENENIRKNLFHSILLNFEY